MYDMKIWSEVEPPKGTIYNYPVRPWHEAEYYIAGSSAPPEIAVQMWNRSMHAGMVARLHVTASRSSSRSPGRRTSWKALSAEAVFPNRPLIASGGRGMLRPPVFFRFPWAG